MELLYTEKIHDKCAELYMDSDHVIIAKYDGLVIDRSGGETYLNLRTDDVRSIYLQLCVADYELAEKKEMDLEELKDFARGIGWEV